MYAGFINEKLEQWYMSSVEKRRREGGCGPLVHYVSLPIERHMILQVDIGHLMDFNFLQSGI